MTKRRYYSDKHLGQMERLDGLLIFIEAVRDEIEAYVEPSLLDSHTKKESRRWLDPIHEAIDDLEAEAFNMDMRIRGDLF